MTQLTNPTDTRRSTARRRDSLALWLFVAGGSLLLHLALFLGIRWFNLRVSVAQPDAVPIELIDDAPPSNPATLAPSPKPATESPTPTAPAQPEQARSETSAPSLEALPAERRSATPQTLPQREIPRTPIPTSTPTPTPVSSPNPDSDPSPSAPNPGSSDNSVPPIAPEGGAVSPPTPVPPVPGSPNPPLGESGELPSVPVDRQENAPQSLSGITVSLTARSSPRLLDGDPLNPPDQSATPKQTTRSFTSDLTSSVFGSASVGDAASCELNSEVAPYLGSGQSVPLRLYIDEQGKVLEANPIADDNAYSRLAGCLLKQWEFAPAMLEGSPVQSDDLVVEVILTRN